MMLSDGCEAAVRASKDHSTEAIGATVRKVVQERLADGQLDECDLTLRDLDRIKQAFVQVLQGIYHPGLSTRPTIAAKPRRSPRRRRRCSYHHPSRTGRSGRRRGECDELELES